MFTSLRYQRKRHYWCFRLLLLRFDTLAITAPHDSISRGTFAVSELVYTTETCAAPGGVYTTEAWAASGRVYNTEACAAPGCVYSYTTGGRSCTWTWLDNRSMRCCWTCLHYRDLWCIWTCLHTGGSAASGRVNPQELVPTYCRTCSLRLKNNILTVEHVCFA
jgi:hypothetical protein